MLIGACASSLPKTSQAKTDAFLQGLATAQIEPAALSRAWIASLVEYWIQPVNLAEECKIMLRSPQPPEGVTAYWDGRCKDGYAIGLGRAFLDTDDGLTSWLEEYSGGARTPINHYSTFHDTNSTNLGDPQKGGAMIMQIYDGPAGFNLRSGYNVVSADDLTGNFMIMDTKEDVISWIKTYPNGTTLNFWHSTNEAAARKFVAGYSDKTGKNIGYSVHVYRNGVVEHWDEQDSAFTQLPAAFIDRLNREYAEMGAMFRMAEKTAAAGQNKLNIYTRRTCTGDISVDYLDSKLYGQICLEEGDLSPYSEKIAAARSSVEDRRERNVQLAQKNAERLAQQQVASRQNAAKQAAQTAAAAQAFNQSMSEFNKNMSTFTQTMMNNNVSSNTSAWSTPPQRKVLNCFEMGNIVTCQ